ncbi:hypothetical protein [Nocardioides cynanchi]|uniref:hypothetical protein n=1 Tax=Nocardioides cynanchi TaxID=2558918 RepID=UPI0012447B9B|nr:hypothetical protein [Nocardioides cynanchi]
MHALLRALVSGAALLALAGCGTSDSGSPAGAVTGPTTPAHDGIGARVHVSGRLEGVGGPAAQPPRPWPGTVSWTGPTHGTVRVGHDGSFTLDLPAGRYLLTGHSPAYGDGRYVCQAPHPLVVRPGAPAHLDVLCQMR